MADALASFARAQRAHEHLNLVRLGHGEAALGRWVAISLADGSCDQNLYATKAEAVRFQLHETQCAYLNISGWPTLGELRLFLDMNEELYDGGMRLADPATYVNPEALL
jgi:hypothetical protein